MNALASGGMITDFWPFIALHASFYRSFLSPAPIFLLTSVSIAFRFVVSVTQRPRVDQGSTRSRLLFGRR